MPNTSAAMTVNQDRLVSTFLDLVRLNTPPRSERLASEMAMSILQELGFDCRFDDAGIAVGGDVGNLFASKKGTVAGAPTIFFSAHFDTVEPTEGIDPIIEGDIIRSDGNTVLGADDKCGIAPILEAMRMLVEHEVPHGDIQLILTICEEIGLVGAGKIDRDDITSAYGFVLDGGPPVGSFVYSAPTQDIFEVWIRGKSSHAGALPEEGVSAISIAAKAVARMNIGRVDHETTANVGIIRGGVATNIIPAECYLKCEARSRNIDKLIRTRDTMINLFKEEADAAGGSVSVECYNAYPGYELNMKATVLAIGAKAAENIGLEPLMRVTGGGADANIFNALGIPTTVLGCGMMNIHRHDEYVKISDMVKTTELVISIVQTAAVWQEE